MCENLRKERNKFKKKYRKNRQDRIKLQKVLEEIEDICKNGRLDICYMPLDECSLILDIIDKLREEGLLNGNKEMD